MNTPIRELWCRTAALVAVLLCFPGVGFGQEPKPLRWGTDPTGGAPFVYQDAAGNYTGFEWDFAAYLAKKLGRASTMVAGDWSNLPQLLDKDTIDVVLNGYELREDLCVSYAPTRPYYIYRLALLSRKDNDAVRGWADLYNPRVDKDRKTIGVLGGTVAQEYLEKEYKDKIDLRSNQDVANVIKLVADKRLDGTVQDSPAATYFLREYPELRRAGDAIRPGFYVLYYRKSDLQLGAQLDRAISEGIRDGSLKAICTKYNLWTKDQERLSYWLNQPWPTFETDDDAETTDATKAADENPLPRLVKELVYAAFVTVKLALLSFPLAMAVGLIVAIGRVYGPRWLGVPLGIYVEVVRGTPLLLQLFMIFYLLPQLLTSSGVGLLMGIAAGLTPFVAGVLGLAINYSAYEAENYRAGLLAIPKGQMEAALALGMTRTTALRRIVVPQALRIVIPPVTNDFIALFKDTSACSIILVVELTRKYNELFNFNRTLIVELAFLTAGLYLLMSYPLALLAGRLERKLAAPGHGGKP